MVLSAGHCGLPRTLRACPQANHPLLYGCRHRSGFALARDELGTLNVFVPGIGSTEDFDSGATLTIGPSAGDPDPLTGRPVADVGSVHRHIAGLSVHLDGALALIDERHDQISFLSAPQHARVPSPVEQD